MTDAMLVQEFQIGQRVLVGEQKPFVITAISLDGWKFYYARFIGQDTWYFSHELTLCPEPPPYVPSDRLVVARVYQKAALYRLEVYRCETDAELAARHAIERAEYGAQGDET